MQISRVEGVLQQVDNLHESGDIETKQGKQGLWSSLKRILHIPSVPKSQRSVSKSQPGMPNPSAATSSKQGSKGHRTFSGLQRSHRQCMQFIHTSAMVLLS